MDLGTSPTSGYVERFAALMEEKLAENRHKGNREGWLQDDTVALVQRLRQETDEIVASIVARRRPAEIARECADVANFAMFIADRVGGLGE